MILQLYFFRQWHRKKRTKKNLSAHLLFSSQFVYKTIKQFVYNSSKKNIWPVLLISGNFISVMSNKIRYTFLICRNFFQTTIFLICEQIKMYCPGNHFFHFSKTLMEALLNFKKICDNSALFVYKIILIQLSVTENNVKRIM